MNVGEMVDVSAVITKNFTDNENTYSEGTYTGQASVETKSVDNITVYYLKPIYSSLK